MLRCLTLVNDVSRMRHRWGVLVFCGSHHLLLASYPLLIIS